ncbi:MAG: D-alanine--D-alanine ligase [Clostridia bacterium]|nr:D-alanine--D-alanine ligase [Clostridia bacterium]
MHKKRIAVIFGGASSEHEVSRVSAASVIDNMPKDKYDIFTVGITKDGEWLLTSATTEQIASGEWENDEDNLSAFIAPDPSIHGLCVMDNGRCEQLYIDAVFPVLHGKYGEDGTIQGLFEMAQLPYVGCATASSAVCMDKIFTNTVLEQNGIAQAKWLWFTKYDYFKNAGHYDDIIEKELGFPCFVKPANAGSSVGITKVKSREALADAIRLAAENDRRILVEEGIDGLELECAVLGNDQPIASIVGQIDPGKEFYDYEAKYSCAQSLLYIPAKVDESIIEDIRRQAVKAYRALDCAGLSRVDFFLRKSDNAILLNEVNTLPGFTSISMYPKLFDYSGIPYSELLDRIISLAFERDQK